MLSGMQEDLLKAAMREMGARGGNRRYETLSTERLTQITRKAGIQSGIARRKKAAAKRKTEAA
jgi:hypothetical protein